MSDYLKQHLFCEENISDYYLSPYVHVQKTAEGICIGREDRDASVILPDMEGQGEIFVQRLAQGMAEEEILPWMQKLYGEDGGEWLACFIQRGLIE